MTAARLELVGTDAAGNESRAAKIVVGGEQGLAAGESEQARAGCACSTARTAASARSGGSARSAASTSHGRTALLGAWMLLLVGARRVKKKVR
ncbi:MAG: hypothetical protein IT384_27220 [Deltaproteobacteria bacterium]|nr:hypothetical protein [Deltaproteobacteria bacterium]